MQAIINPSKEIPYPKLPNYYPPMLLEVQKICPTFCYIRLPEHIYTNNILLFMFQMVQLCLKHNPKERASVADLLKFPIEMVIPINK